MGACWKRGVLDRQLGILYSVIEESQGSIYAKSGCTAARAGRAREGFPPAVAARSLEGDGGLIARPPRPKSMADWKDLRLCARTKIVRNLYTVWCRHVGDGTGRPPSPAAPGRSPTMRASGRQPPDRQAQRRSKPTSSSISGSGTSRPVASSADASSTPSARARLPWCRSTMRCSIVPAVMSR